MYKGVKTIRLWFHNKHMSQIAEGLVQFVNFLNGFQTAVFFSIDFGYKSIDDLNSLYEAVHPAREFLMKNLKGTHWR